MTAKNVMTVESANIVTKISGVTRTGVMMNTARRMNDN